MTDCVTILDKEFISYLPEEKIQQRIAELAAEINRDYQNKSPLFIAVLNGSFMFASDLMKRIIVHSQISFVKLASYQGMESSGKIKQLVGLNENIYGKHIIVIEDIIDSGITITNVLDDFNALGPKSVEVVTLLRKPECLQRGIDFKYVGFDISDKFVVGYGLDYDGLGRNFRHIYQLKT